VRLTNAQIDKVIAMVSELETLSSARELIDALRTTTPRHSIELARRTAAVH
jgi:hypothetical protein